MSSFVKKLRVEVMPIIEYLLNPFLFSMTIIYIILINDKLDRKKKKKKEDKRELLSKYLS